MLRRRRAMVAAMGGGAAVPIPQQISGLALWLRGADITGNDGDVVAAWSDASDNSNDFSQSDNDKKPLLKTGANGINGLSVVRFDGTNDLMTAANFLSSTQGTVFFVVRFTATIKNTQDVIASSDQATNNFWWLIRGYSTANLLYGQRNNDTNDLLGGSTAISASTVYLMTFKSDGSTISARVNGAAETLSVVGGANNGDWLGDTAGRDNFSIGAAKQSVETNFLKGDLAELVMYDTGLSVANIDKVEEYLAARFDINLA